MFRVHDPRPLIRPTTTDSLLSCASDELERVLVNDEEHEDQPGVDGQAQGNNGEERGEALPEEVICG